MDPLIVYFDEAGSEGDPRSKHNCMGMAGVVAPETLWRTFAVQWQHILDHYEIEFFHMKDFAHWKGFFKDRGAWTEDRRRALMSNLLAAIAFVRPRMIGVTIDLIAWRALTPVQRSHFGAAWAFCLAIAAKEANNIAEDLQISMLAITSQQDEYTRDASRILGVYDDAPLLVNGGMRAMQTCLPLQVADILAYELIKNMEFMAPDDPRPFRLPLRALLSIDPTAKFVHFTTKNFRVMLDHWNVE